jgi:AhpD family alkylhydroperoxidase
MKNRLSFFEKGQAAVKPLFGITGYLKKASIEESLRHLIEIRVSQINGCAYCLDMHHKEARHHGETDQRLYSLAAWREAPFYTGRERAALAWAEAVTAVHVSDEVYAEVTQEFGDEELIDLTMAVTAINTWNRINIAFSQPAMVGTYRVGQFG